jgi:RHS repeat-associated protein
VQTRAYAYDALGRLASATTPEAGAVCFGTISGGICQPNGYDSFDNLLFRTDARGVQTNYTYDGLNRLHQVTYTVGTSGVPATPTVTLNYGTVPTQNNNGRLSSMTDGPGSENYSYDILGQVTQLQKVISGTTYTTQYAYNLAGEMTQATYPSGRIVQQSFDAIGRLCEIAPSTTGCSTATNPYATGFSYNVASQPTFFLYGNGVMASYSYSPDRLQLSSLAYYQPNCASLFKLNYGYAQNGGNNGQITSVANPGEPGQSVNYVYDALARLSTATSVGSSGYPQWGLSFAYDRYGNRTDQNQTIGGPPMNHVTFDPTKNRISTGGYGYDASGNMTGDGNNTLVYDAENRVLSATNGAASGTYTYDGNGLRVKKVSGGTTTVYVFSGSKVIAEYDNGAAVGSPSREYIYSGDRLLATSDSAGTRYHHYDQVSVRFTTDSTQSYSAHLGQYPFGEMWYDDGSTTTKDKFATYERDAESGNDYALARYHENRLGRFSSPDALGGSAGNPQSLNRYTYALNDPIDLVDPSGQNPVAEDPSDEGGGGDEPGIPIPVDGGEPGGLTPPDLGPAPIPPYNPNDPLGPATQPGVPSGYDTVTVTADAPADIMTLMFSYPNDLTQAAGGGGGWQGLLKTIETARAATYLALLNDPKCLSFLGGDGLSTLSSVAIVPTGYSGAGPIAATIFSPALEGGPGPQININEAGPFFTPGRSYGPQRLAGASPRFQANVLLHEVGHITGALRPEGSPPNVDMSIENANNAAIASHCKKALSGLSNVAPHK